MIVFSSISKRLRELAGVSEEIIQQCDESERRKFTGIGFAMLLPPFFGALTMGYIIYTFSQNPYLSWTISSLIWAPIILIIDQALITTFRKPINVNPIIKFFLYIRTIVPRFVIAILLGALIAFPAELLIFHGPIQNRLETKHQEQVSEIREKFRDKNQELIERKKKLKQEISSKRKEFKEFSYLYSSEIHGKEVTVSGYETSGLHGQGVQAEQFHDLKMQAKRSLEELKDQNIPVINRLQSRIDKNRELMEKDVREIEDTQSTSFIYQLQVLEEMSDDYPIIFIVKWGVFGLVICLEIMPVFVRIIAPIGKYDEILLTNEYSESMDYSAKRSSIDSNYQELTKMYSDKNFINEAKDVSKQKMSDVSDLIFSYQDIKREHNKAKTPKKGMDIINNTFDTLFERIRKHL